MPVWAGGTFAEFTSMVALFAGHKGIYAMQNETVAADNKTPTPTVRRAAVLFSTATTAEAIVFDFGLNGPTQAAFIAGAGAGYVQVEGIKPSQGI